MKKHDTPLLDQLETGPWPSFVKELKLAAKKSEMANDELGQLEKSYRDKKGYWKHGGIVGVLGYGSGVIGRYSSLPEEFPGVAHFHTFRINQPSGMYYKTDRLREIMDLWDKYGSGLTNMHGSTGDIILLGMRTENLEPLFAETSSRGWDLGGSGSALRTPACCLGKSRCEWANIDTMDICNELTQTYQDYMHRPSWPYKFKFKIAGCAVDCVASIARADCSIIGTWKGDIAIDQDAVKDYAKKGMNIQAEIVDMCPTGCMSYDGKSLSIDNANCSRCMHCISKMTKALKPTGERGASILIGSKAPIVVGSLLSWVIVPFIKMEPPYTEFKALVEKMWDWWDENAKPRERIGEVIEMKGMRSFLEAIGVPPVPQQVREPRKDPFFFWSESDLENK
ncbi:MAG: dissimilatory-type sulfite reductase subunit alpha [Actinomycetota bacterium]|nr:dissimilatory-type sulfite reductase subunit alpha [Nitrospiraceae bacterium]MDA8157148.1 dissimilatory-type sulfite reductase subunit alpha [Actinomycetota bacterium]MDA8175191.1 dissimilatory-type sulfite reductase subunit alpha [Nitrospiraceae bacterium]